MKCQKTGYLFNIMQFSCRNACEIRNWTKWSGTYFGKLRINDFDTIVYRLDCINVIQQVT